MAFLNSCAPLIYELVAENGYPVPEDVVSGLTNQIVNLFGFLFYVVFSQMSDHSTNDYSWLLYTLMVIPTLVTILFIFAKETYARSDATSSGSMVQYRTDSAAPNDHED